MWKNALNKENAKRIALFSILKKVFMVALLLTVNLGESCEPGFTETLNIKVLDSKYRGIEDAAVHINYQKDRTFGKGFVNTTTQYTDEDGKAAITVRNTEPYENRVDCGLTIYAEYDGVIVKREIEAQKHAAEIQVQFEQAYLLSLKVVDKFGAQIEETQIRVNDIYKNTSESGYVGIIVNQGTVDIAVPYMSGVISQELDVFADTTYTLQARIYALDLEVVDDSGDPLAAQITLEDQEYQDTGLHIAETAVVNPYLKVVYGSLEKTPAVDLSEESKYVVSFDLTPPEIKNVDVERKEKNVKIVFFVQDPNPLASGPDLDETTVTYTVGGVTEVAIPYVDSGSYVVEVPAPPENSLLRFTITAHDMEGNMNTVNGEYLITPEGGDVGDIDNEEEDVASEETEDGILPLVVGSLVILLLAYVVYSYFRGISEEK